MDDHCEVKVNGAWYPFRPARFWSNQHLILDFTFVRPLSSMGNPSTFTVWLSRQKPRVSIPASGVR